MKMKKITLYFLMIAFSSYVYAAEQCTYVGTSLDFTAVPGKVCVNTLAPQLKPQFLELSSGKLNPRFDLTPDGCFSELVMGIDPTAFQKHCYIVQNIVELETIWNQAVVRQEIGENYVETYGLKSNAPNWTALTARLKEIIQQSSPVIDPGSSRVGQ